MAGMPPEERAALNAKQRARQQLEKNVSWLKLDGVRAGGFAVLRGNSQIVAVVTDPAIDSSGERIVMAIKSGKEGKIDHVDAMLYRPHFAEVHAMKQKEEAKTTAAHVAARSTKPKGGRKPSKS